MGQDDDTASITLSGPYWSSAEDSSTGGALRRDFSNTNSQWYIGNRATQPRLLCIGN